MSFVPSFFDYLITHLQQEERRRMLSSIAVTAAPEHWLSLEAAALLDTNRERFGLGEALKGWHNVPRWLIAAERKKVDLWVEDQKGHLPPYSIEFKVVHNNKNAYHKIREIRRDLGKVIPNIECNERVIRWGVVLLIFHRFYQDQSGGYAVNKSFDDCQGMLKTFQFALEDDDEWYEGAPQLEQAVEPVLICDTSNANYIDASEGQSAIFMTLVKKKIG